MISTSNDISSREQITDVTPWPTAVTSPEPSTVAMVSSRLFHAYAPPSDGLAESCLVSPSNRVTELWLTVMVYSTSVLSKLSHEVATNNGRENSIIILTTYFFILRKY